MTMQQKIHLLHAHYRSDISPIKRAEISQRFPWVRESADLKPWESRAVSAIDEIVSWHSTGWVGTDPALLLRLDSPPKNNIWSRCWDAILTNVFRC